MAADSAAVDGDIISQRKNSKIWHVSVGQLHMLVGFCGSYNEAMFLRYSFAWPTYKGPIEQYLISKVLPKLCKELKARFGEVRDDELQMLVGIANPGRIFMVLMPSDIEEGEHFLAIGSGAMTALGCLNALYTLNHGTKEQQMIMALETSEKFHTSVRGPMQIETLGI
jgi:ATP-dependent protease HslVU (ClpYQ) peptidase subunit